MKESKPTRGYFKVTCPKEDLSCGLQRPSLQGMNSRHLFSLLSFLAALLLASSCELFAVSKPHTVGLGSIKRVAHSTIGDPADAAMKGTTASDSDLKIRPLVVDGQVKEWTTGEAHDITDRSFTIRRALHINDTLPADSKERWVWQKGSWIVVDRASGHVSALHLPDYDPAVSDVIWFRDYAAYCGLPATGKSLYAVVAQVGARRAILAKKLTAWTLDDHPTPACAASIWQREPLRITFNPAGNQPVSFDLVGLSAVLVEDGDNGDPE